MDDIIAKRITTPARRPLPSTPLERLKSEIRKCDNGEFRTLSEWLELTGLCGFSDRDAYRRAMYRKIDHLERMGYKGNCVFRLRKLPECESDYKSRRIVVGDKQFTAYVSERHSVFFVYGRNQSSKRRETLLNMAKSMIDENCSGMFFTRLYKKERSAQYSNFLQIVEKEKLAITVKEVKCKREFNSLAKGIRNGSSERCLYVLNGSEASVQKVFDIIPHDSEVKYVLGIDECDMYLNEWAESKVSKNLKTMKDGAVVGYFISATQIDSWFDWDVDIPRIILTPHTSRETEKEAISSSPDVFKIDKSKIKATEMFKVYKIARRYLKSKSGWIRRREVARHIYDQVSVKTIHTVQGHINAITKEKKMFPVKDDKVKGMLVKKADGETFFKYNRKVK